MHWLGLEGMPRRYASYEVFAKRVPRCGVLEPFETVFSFCMVASIGLLAFNIIWSLRHGKPAGINPWGARTLEWMISSPPPYYNFKKIPESSWTGRTTSISRCRTQHSTTNSSRIRNTDKVVMPSSQLAGAGA